MFKNFISWGFISKEINVDSLKYDIYDKRLDRYISDVVTNDNVLSYFDSEGIKGPYRMSNYFVYIIVQDSKAINIYIDSSLQSRNVAKQLFKYYVDRGCCMQYASTDVIWNDFSETSYPIFYKIANNSSTDIFNVMNVDDYLQKEQSQKEILDFLERCYMGAESFDDADTMIRLDRAIAAFKLDPDKESAIDEKIEKSEDELFAFKNEVQDAFDKITLILKNNLSGISMEEYSTLNSIYVKD